MMSIYPYFCNRLYYSGKKIKLYNNITIFIEYEIVIYLTFSYISIFHSSIDFM